MIVKAMTGIDLMMASGATGAIYLISLASSVLATQTAPFTPTANPETQFVRWAIEQGGLVVAILVILFFYRRDFREMEGRYQEFVKSQRATLDTVVELVETNTRAMERLAASIDDAQNDRFPPRRHLSS